MTAPEIRAICPFCNEQTRAHVIDSTQALSYLTGLLFAHYVESHWDVLAAARAARTQMGGSYDSWKRL